MGQGSGEAECELPGSSPSVVCMDLALTYLPKALRTEWWGRSLPTSQTSHCVLPTEYRPRWPCRGFEDGAELNCSLCAA